MNCVAGIGMEAPYSSGGGRGAALLARSRSGLRQLDAIDHLEKRACARLDDIGAHTGAPVAAMIVLHVHPRLALGILALGDGVHLELTQRDRDAGRGLDRLERGIDWPIAAGGALCTAARAMPPLRVSVVSSSSCQGPAALPSARSTSASMSPSKSSFFLSASALNSSNTRLNSASSSSKPSAFTRSRNAWRPLCLPNTRWLRDNPTSSGRRIS